jgi:hypothetical protein
MARPTQTRIREGAGFAPEVRQAPSLQVVAPLNVQAAPSGAELLARSLGLALDTVTPVALDKIKTQAADATALGRGDATINKVDAKRKAEDASYAVGVKRGMVDRAIVDFKSMARTFYEEQFDKSQGTELLAQELDNIAKGALQNYTSDPDAVRWMTPEVANTVASITGAHDTELAKQFKDDRISSAAALMRDAFQQQQGIDPEDIMNRLRPVLGNSEATKAYVGMVGSLAVENGAPEIIDALIPEKWGDGTPGPRSTPALNQALNLSRYYAQEAARKLESELNSVAKSQAEDVLFAATLDAMKGVDPSIMLAQARAAGLPISESELRATIGFFRGSRSEQLDVESLSAFRAAMIENPLSFTPNQVQQFITSTMPMTPESHTPAQNLWDDYQRMRESALEISKNPTAKAYRTALTTKYKLATWDGEAEKARFSAGILAFDLEMINSKDAEKAREAAEKIFGNADPGTRPTAQPSNNAVTDVKALAAGKMDERAFVKAYSSAEAEQSLLRRYHNRELTKAEIEKALAVLEAQ